MNNFKTTLNRPIRPALRYLLLDLSDVNYISSAGLRALHNIYKLFRADAADESSEAISKGITDGTYKAHQLKLLNPNSDVSRILKMAGFDMYLDIFHNQKEAVAAF